MELLTNSLTEHLPSAVKAIPSRMLSILCSLYVSYSKQGSDYIIDELFNIERRNDKESIEGQFLLVRNYPNEVDKWLKIFINHNNPYIAKYLFSYCSLIEDREDMWKALANINHPYAAQWKVKYCREVRDRDEMWKSLCNADVSNREVAKALYDYCVRVKRRKEVIDALRKSKHKDLYQLLGC